MGGHSVKQEKKLDDDAAGSDLGPYRYNGKRRYFDSRGDINNRFVDRALNLLSHEKIA